MFIILFWSITFIAILGLLMVYRLGLTSFEPVVSFLVLAGLTAVLSIIFHQLGGHRANDHRLEALRKLFSATGLLTLALWLGVSGISGYLLFRDPPKTIQIGVDLPLTGDEGAKGIPILAGMYLGLEKERATFAQETGYNLEFVIKDDAQANGSFDVQKGSNNIESLITKDKVAAILGPYNTDVALKAIPIVNQHHIAMLSSTTTSNCLTEPSTINLEATRQCSQALQASYSQQPRAFFRMTAANSDIADVVANCVSINNTNGLCPKATKFSKLVVLRDDTTFGAELAVYLKERWLALSGSTTTDVLSFIDQPVNDGELSEEMREKIADHSTKAEPALVYFAGTKQLEKLYENIRHIPYTSFASNSSITNAAFTSYLDKLGVNNPIYASSGDRSIDRGSVYQGNSRQTQTGVEDYIAAYQEGYKQDGKLANDLIKHARRQGIKLPKDRFNATSPPPASATGYDAARVLVAAIKKAMSQVDEKEREANPQKFREAIITNLRGIEQGSQYTYQGVTGTYNGFDTKGGLKDYTPVSVYEYQRGRTPRWQSQ